MAKNKKEQLTEEKNEEFHSDLIKELNKTSETEQVAWCLTDLDSPTEVKDWISTGSTLLDYAISNKPNGGIPVGKITELSGEEASGKSLIASHILANTQKKGGLAVYIDNESALSPEFAVKLGMNLDKLVYMQCPSIESVFENIEKIITTIKVKNINKIVTIVWDSIALTPPQAELEGNYDPNSQMGIGAKAMSRGLRKLTQTVGKESITLVATNQLRHNMKATPYMDPWIVPCGKAMPYAASVRVRLHGSSKLKDDDKKIYGIHTRAEVVKNRLGPPKRQVEFDILFKNGVDNAGSIRDYLHEIKLIEKKGGWMLLKKENSDENYQFRSSEFKNLLASDEEFKKHVFNLLEKNMVVTYEQAEKEFEEKEPEGI